MREAVGDLWDFHDRGSWIVITTNGTIKPNGALVMGRGVARQARNRFLGIDILLGDVVRRRGNTPVAISQYRIITFPTKHNWWEPADIRLIKTSAKALAHLWNPNRLLGRIRKAHESAGWFSDIYLPRPGCGNGGLLWEDVKPVIEPYFDNRFVVVTEGD